VPMENDRIVSVWHVEGDEINQAQARRLAADLGVAEPVGTLLINRGLETAEDAKTFMNPALSAMHQPLLLPDMDVAIDRLSQAIANREALTVYGDYDVDGITSTTLLVRFWERLELQVDYYIPHRMEEGYGLHAESIRKLADNGSRLLVCVDTGSTALAEASLAHELGMELIIIDHHRMADELPKAVAVVNPQREENQYPFKEMAAVGVTFNLLVALRARLIEQGVLQKGQIDLRDDLDLVALGTVADLVPLRDVNRIFTSVGLQRLTHAKRAGVLALKEAARIRETVRAGQVAFFMAPRLNAGGRLSHAKQGVELFLSKDLNHARGIAEELNSLNQQRQRVEQNAFKQACAMLEGSDYLKSLSVIVLASPEWHPGVVGIVASRMVERYQKPAFLIALDEDDVGKASGRSVKGIDVHEALKAASAHLVRFGGHAMAAGFTIERHKIDTFREDLAAAVQNQTGGDYVPTRFVRVDMMLSPEHLNDALMADISQLEPFGMGNPQPVFAVDNVYVVSSEIRGGQHLKFQLSINNRRFSAMGFRMARHGILKPGSVMKMAYQASYNTFQGIRSIDLRIKDFVLKT